MSSYYLLQVEWKSNEARQAYISSLAGMVEKYGGRFIVASSESKVVEGQWPAGRTVIAEFPNREALMRWYDSPEYLPLLEERLKNSTSNAVVVDGV